MKQTRRRLFSSALSSLAGAWVATSQWGLVAALLPGCRDPQGTTPGPDGPPSNTANDTAGPDPDDTASVDPAPVDSALTADPSASPSAADSAPPVPTTTPTQRPDLVKPKYGGPVPVKPKPTTKYGGRPRPVQTKYGGNLGASCGCAPGDLMCEMECSRKP